MCTKALQRACDGATQDEGEEEEVGFIRVWREVSIVLEDLCLSFHVFPAALSMFRTVVQSTIITLGLRCSQFPSTELLFKSTQ